MDPLSHFATEIDGVGNIPRGILCTTSLQCSRLSQYCTPFTCSVFCYREYSATSNYLVGKGAAVTLSAQSTTLLASSITYDASTKENKTKAMMAAKDSSSSASRVKEVGAWSEQFSSSGKRYYYNRQTEVSQWEKPTEWKEYEKKLIRDNHSRLSSNKTNGLSSNRYRQCLGNHSTSSKNCVPNVTPSTSAQNSHGQSSSSRKRVHEVINEKTSSPSPANRAYIHNSNGHSSSNTPTPNSVNRASSSSHHHHHRSEREGSTSRSNRDRERSTPQPSRPLHQQSQSQSQSIPVINGAKTESPTVITPDNSTPVAASLPPVPCPPPPPPIIPAPLNNIVVPIQVDPQSSILPEASAIEGNNVSLTLEPPPPMPPILDEPMDMDMESPPPPQIEERADPVLPQLPTVEYKFDDAPYSKFYRPQLVAYKKTLINDSLMCDLKRQNQRLLDQTKQLVESEVTIESVRSLLLTATNKSLLLTNKINFLQNEINGNKKPSIITPAATSSSAPAASTPSTNGVVPQS